MPLRSGDIPRSSAVSLFVRGAGELLTIPPSAGPRRRGALREVGLLKNAAVAIAGDRVVAVGHENDLLKTLGPIAEEAMVDAGGRVVTPGLIDPHTHPVYAGNRAGEFESRILGKSYREIAKAGGGIRATVRSTREASSSELESRTGRRLMQMFANGTTTAEAKSGYGLSLESELTQLRALRTLSGTLPIELVPTFLGAHEIPDEYQGRREKYIDLLIHEMLPAVTAEKLAAFSDVFCDQGVYSIDETRTIQSAALRSGLGLKLHADELASTGGAELACQLGAFSADHLIRVSDAGLSALQKSDTLAVLLPGTSFSLGALHFAPGRKMVDEGVAVALASDCNAGSCRCESLTMAAALAAQYYKFTAAESWCCLTGNAAWAIGRAATLGSLAQGYQADLVVWDMEDHRELGFHFGVNLAHQVFKKGRLLATDGVVH